MSTRSRDMSSSRDMSGSRDMPESRDMSGDSLSEDGHCCDDDNPIL